MPFSGSPESIVLADACIPWRHQVTLLWVNTTGQVPEAVDLVRSYGRQFRMIGSRRRHRSLARAWGSVRNCGA
jgi:hypothetical protein